MDRNSPIALEVAMMSHQEMIRDVERRQSIKEVSARNQRSRIFGVRRLIGQSLISIGERVHIEERELVGEDFCGESLSLKLAR